MIRHALYIFFWASLFMSVLGCGSSPKQKMSVGENKKAKAMLEGIWLDADEGSLIFRVKGDTIYYPDSTSSPMKFSVIGDTMIFYGNSVFKYPIIRQELHLFEFKNQNGDTIKLVKSEDLNDTIQFVRHSSVVLNQNRIIKRDTIVSHSGNKYHCYLQINPTSYKVYRTVYNGDGLEIENVYFDNIIHISVFSGSTKLFSKDFRKDDFVSCVPKNMLKQSILSDIKLVNLTDKGIHYQAEFAIPDSPSCFIANLTISYEGHFSVHVEK